MVKHYSKGLIFSLLVCAAPIVQAETVSVEDAKGLAAEFFQASSLDRLSTADALELAYTHTSGGADKPLYYVFNARDGHGFIIMSADDCATPVLGYSAESTYNVSSLPPAMKWMMQGLESEIKIAPRVQSSATRDARRMMVRRAAGNNEKILLNTPQWRQEAPFNSMIPGHPLTGCVGTAMAMIMKYHNFPERGTGSYNGVNFDVAYDWDHMRMDNYYSGYSQEEADAVATLIYHTGVSIGTQFGYSGSSAYEVKVPAALINYFSYDPGVSYKKRSETATQAEFDHIVENEIRAGRPVLYCGQDVTAGHAFVVDGFDPLSQMIHINWGWGGIDGNNNGGWYASTALNPNASQSHSFNNLTTIIYNIKPGDGNNSAWSPIHITADARQLGMSSNLEGDLTAGKAFTVRVGNLKNVSYDNFSGKITVALFGADGSFKSGLSKIDGFHLNGMTIFSSGYTDFACSLPEGIEVADGDVIRMATRADNSTTWLPVPGELITTNEIPARGAAPQYFSITRPASIADATFTGESKVIKGWNYSFRIVPSYPDRDVVTVKSNGYALTPDANYNYTVRNVLENQNIEVYVQNAADVKEKRSIWVGTPGTLETILTGADAGTVKDLTLFGTIDARDFTFMRNSMKLTRLDLSGVRIAANGSNQANAIPRDAFRNLWGLREVILPGSVNRLNNGCFRYCGITSIVIPAAVNTYEYNVFLGASSLSKIWVLNPKPVFVNWCVFNGTPKNRTVFCPNWGAKTAYEQDKWWNQPDVDAGVTFKSFYNDAENQPPVPSDCAFAVMENNDVRYTSDTEPGRYEKGKKVTFTAEYIADNDNRMEVYANSTLLKPDAEGKYSFTINSSTIVHFDMIEPVETAAYPSQWKITDTGGTVGLLTDAVNVLPGIPFVVRVNSFETKNSMFWAFVLTTADGKIKEFISPVSSWNLGDRKGQKMNVTCCVKDASVREGNLIRFATSFNNKVWTLVEGSNEEVIDRLPALNNQTPVYNFTFPENLAEKANLSGIVESAVRGRDLTFKITPKTASHTLDIVLNGDTIMTGGKTFTYSFIAKEDLDFDVKVIPPVSYTEATIVLGEGEHLYLSGYEEGHEDDWDVLNHQMVEKYQNIKKLKIVGKIDDYDFNFFRNNYMVAANIRHIDLSEAILVRPRSVEIGNDNWFPSNAFYNPVLKGCLVEEIILPNSVKVIDSNAFNGCSRIKEIRLPESLHVWSEYKYVKPGDDKTSRKNMSGIQANAFAGCTSLETIYVPCTPGKYGNVGHLNYIKGSPANKLETGLPDNTKVTLVVPAEYLTQYLTPKENGQDWFATDGSDWNNGWVAGGFNIVGQYPVYSLSYDASRCFPAEAGFNADKAASFLKDNIGLEQIECKLYIARRSSVTENRPEGVDTLSADSKIKVYVDGTIVPDDAIAADGSISLTYYNPNKHADLSGNHTVKVEYYYDVVFNCASENVAVVSDTNESLTSSEVKENSTVRFKVQLNGLNAEELTAMVKTGETMMTADEEGYYTLEVTDSNIEVNVYAVPRNGATLSAADIDVINAAEASNVTTIAFAGDIDSDKLVQVINQLPELEDLNLSALSASLPADALAGNENITTITLPNAADIEAGTFSGCVNLTSVSVPETVEYIGADAFSGCSSLSNLSFTGIKGIGENAFANCDNLTSIIFNSQRGSSPARARRVARTPRAEGFTAGSFDGLNPNCLVYLDENEEVPQGVNANFIKVLTEETAEGKERVYRATGSIELDARYPFSAINTFSIPEGNDISMEMQLWSSDGESAWSPMLLPFTPAKAIDATGNEMIIFDSPKAEPVEGKNYMIAALNTENVDFELCGAIEANVPYLAATHKATDSRTVRFTTPNAVVEQTPEEIRVHTADYDLLGTYQNLNLDAATTYVLDETGSSFSAGEAEAYAENDNTASGRQVAPFSVYVAAPEGTQPITLSVPVDDVTTGIDDTLATSAELRIERDGDDLLIHSERACEIKMYNLSGIIVRVLHLSAGVNRVDGLSSGVYVLNGVKVML